MEKEKLNALWALREIQKRMPLRNDFDAYLHEVIAYGLGEVSRKPVLRDYCPMCHAKKD
jgi:hypothetical protein